MAHNNMGQSDIGADFQARCAAIIQALRGNDQELLEARDDLRHARAELAHLEELTDILFALIDRMWVVLCSYGQGQGEAFRQRQLFESILDVAIMQLDLQNVRIDCDALRREKRRLEESLQMNDARSSREYALP